MKGEEIKSFKSLFSEPCIYQVTVSGEMGPLLIEFADDMQIRENKESGTISLVGWLPDQAALLGLLNTLHQIHYGIISLKALPSE